ncbi:MAG TPA: ATP synthase F1 subunit gamma [Thermoanaerobaculia bacterium]|nr:ATP synthase F1 subunit gamma [Thermoanaerobaculia bacterium]
MANRRAIVKRRKAVRNIKKITRTMQLIATARFQAAMNRATASRPYVDKLAEMVAELGRTGGEGGLEHPLLATREAEAKSVLVMLTSDRGLAGGYNAHVLRAAIEHLDRKAGEGVETDVWMVGKKGISAFRFRRRATHRSATGFDDKPRFARVEPLASELIESFVGGAVDSAYVAYMRFESAGKQVPEVVRLLPIGRLDSDAGGEAADRGPRPQYEVLPSPAELLDRLLPATVRMRLYQAFLDAAVSEQIYRMTAMKAATEAADEMIGDLTRQYNRARQTQITLELLDIVGGANALA